MNIDKNINRRLEGNLVFSNTGELLFSMNGEQYLCLKDMAAIQDPGNVDLFLMRYWDSPVVLEQGVTLAQFFLALQPWEKLVSMYTDRNVGSYIAAARRPVAVSPPNDDDFYEIRLSRNIALSRKANFVDDDPSANREDMDFEEWINRPRSKVLTNQFECDAYTSALGYSRDSDLGYSIMTNFDKIKHVPVVWDRATMLYVERTEGVLNPDLDAVVTNESGAQHIELVEQSMKLCEVIHAVIIDGLFFASPKGIEKFQERLERDVHDFEKEQTVLPIEDNAEDKNPKNRMTVSVSDGCFDAVVESIDADAAIWEAVRARANRTDAPIRIGRIIAAQV